MTPGRGQQGFALASVLGVLLVLTLMGAAYLTVSTIYHPGVLQQRDRMRALYAAQSAMHWEAFRALLPPAASSDSTPRWHQPLWPTSTDATVTSDTLMPWVQWRSSARVGNQSANIQLLVGRPLHSELREHAVVLLGPAPPNGIGGWITGTVYTPESAVGSPPPASTTGQSLHTIFPGRAAAFATGFQSHLQQTHRNLLSPPTDSAGRRGALGTDGEERWKGNTSIDVREFQQLRAPIWVVENGDLRLTQRGWDTQILRGPRQIAVAGDCLLEGEWQLEDIELLCEGNLRIIGRLRGKGLRVWAGKSIHISGEVRLQAWLLTPGSVLLEGGAQLLDHSGIISTSTLPSEDGGPTIRLEGRGHSMGWIFTLPGSTAATPSPGPTASPPPVASADYPLGSLYIGREFRHYGILYASTFIHEGFLGGSAWAHRISCSHSPQESCSLSGTIHRDSLPANILQPATLDLGGTPRWKTLRWEAR